ncbi:MAG: EcsC family protein [Lachnospiraceae bacterium]|nr:EcsC family protein [Lachnospiraceae bacterium]
MEKLEIVQKRLRHIEKKETKWVEHAMKQDDDAWYAKLTAKIPKKVETNLQAAFAKGFELLFVNGTGLMNKICARKSLSNNHDINDYAFEVKGTKKSLRKISATAHRSETINTTITFAEGLGMGLTGMGLPDIPVFLGLLLRGVYEIAASFGIDYTKQDEKQFILLLMETVVLRGKEKVLANQAVDEFMSQMLVGEVQAYDFRAQMKTTANKYATDTLFLKFVQGIPIVGIVGGVYNPVYYRRLANYARLKYEKRYLLQKSINLKNGISERK